MDNKKKENKREWCSRDSMLKTMQINDDSDRANGKFECVYLFYGDCWYGVVVVGGGSVASTLGLG